jgi:hypothetical protein
MVRQEGETKFSFENQNQCITQSARPVFSRTKRYVLDGAEKHSSPDRLPDEGLTVTSRP